MWEFPKRTSQLVGDTDRNLQHGTTQIHSSDLVEKMRKRQCLISSDVGTRQGIWHPNIENRFGLMYGHKHVCGVDRGWLPQWPIWEYEEDLVEVPLQEAMLHDDFPTLTLTDGEEKIGEHTHALVMRPQIVDIENMGWAEVVWKVCKARIPGLDPTFFRSFLPMDWYGEIGAPPVVACFNGARRAGASVTAPIPYVSPDQVALGREVTPMVVLGHE